MENIDLSEKNNRKNFLKIVRVVILRVFLFWKIKIKTKTS